MAKRQCVLIISDLHAPYTHPDVVPFLKAVKAKYNPTDVVLTGDEADYHAMSFHDSDVDLDSAGVELEKAIETLRPIYKLFPKAIVLESNHGSLHLRKALANGMPRKLFKGYNDILDAPKGWTWVDDLVMDTPLGRVYFHHSRGPALKTSQLYGMSHVCGHHHNDFNIQYWSTPHNLLFAMTVGCLIDKKSFAFAYNKINLKRPIIGLGVIVNGVPELVPMVLTPTGRWRQRL
jgi:hypothetical protein